MIYNDDDLNTNFTHWEIGDLIKIAENFYLPYLEKSIQEQNDPILIRYAKWEKSRSTMIYKLI